MCQYASLEKEVEELLEREQEIPLDEPALLLRYVQNSQSVSREEAIWYYFLQHDSRIPKRTLIWGFSSDRIFQSLQQLCTFKCRVWHWSISKIKFFLDSPRGLSNIIQMTSLMISCQKRSTVTWLWNVIQSFCNWQPKFGGCVLALLMCFLSSSRKMTGLYYPFHVSYIRICQMAFLDSLKLGKFSVATEYGRMCVKAYEKFGFGSSWKCCGLTHFRLAVAYKVWQNWQMIAKIIT